MNAPPSNAHTQNNISHNSNSNSNNNSNNSKVNTTGTSSGYNFNTLYLDDETEVTESAMAMQHEFQHVHGDTSSIQESAMSTLMFKDCTETVHHMHNLLLYLLSHPEEFQDAIEFYKSKSTTSTLSAFHAEYDRGTDVGSVFNGDDENVPIPFMVFASDAEVVLPQAHTASQLFGYERDNGIELEATSGMVGLCQLFIRWLALMPGGDHMNLVEPPGLTVMRIAGGRYRVTAAHRVVWTWNNEFPHDPLSPNAYKDNLTVGDLVTMTIVDVFETDCDGKLLSYCPTFDNRAVFKTDPRVENLRKTSSKVKKNINIVANSQTAARVNKAATMIGKLGFRAAVTVKDTVQKKMEERTVTQSSPNQDINNAKDFEKALNHAGAGGGGNGRAQAHNGTNHNTNTAAHSRKQRPEHYISDDESTNR